MKKKADKKTEITTFWHSKRFKKMMIELTEIMSQSNISDVIRISVEDKYREINNATLSKSV